MPVEAKVLLDILISQGVFEKSQAISVLKSLQGKDDLFTAVVGTGGIDFRILERAVAKYYGMSYCDLTEKHADKEVSALQNVVSDMFDALIAVFEVGDDVVYVATDEPQDFKRIGKVIAEKVQRSVVMCYAHSKSIQRFLQEREDRPFADFVKTIQGYIDEGEHAGRPEDLPVINIVDELLRFAFVNNASDVHIEPHDKITLVRFRIDGLLHDIITIPKHLHEIVVARLKILSRLRTDEHRSAQDGKLRFATGEEFVDVRVSIVPIVRGEKVVLRLLTDKSQQYELTKLGLRPEDLEKVLETIKQPWGMILATGPTGSGKTTTLYAVLKKLDRREVNISTIEDPVEYDMEGISQIQVNPKTNLTFAAGLRAIVRQDPDIIMVGEIRDEETAGVAINSAMTGHLVLSTLHTNDAATTLPRLLDMGVQPFLVGSTINIVIAQRLVRKICEECKKLMPVEDSVQVAMKKNFSEDLIKKYGLDKPELQLLHGAGCEKCQRTGYRGRMGIYELLEMGDELKSMVMEQANATTIKQRAVELGMLPMIEDGILKVQQGLTTIEEILRVSRE